MRNYIGPILVVVVVAIMVIVGANMAESKSCHPGVVGGEQAQRCGR